MREKSEAMWRLEMNSSFAWLILNGVWFIVVVILGSILNHYWEWFGSLSFWKYVIWGILYLVGFYLITIWVGNSEEKSIEEIKKWE